LPASGGAFEGLGENLKFWNPEILAMGGRRADGQFV